MTGLPKARYGARSGPSKFEDTAWWDAPAATSAYQLLLLPPPPPPPPEEPPPPEPLEVPGAVEEAAMAPEKLLPRPESKPETPCSWKP
ncbi:MAG: hypothetical protein IID48_06490 [Proteobacteria bacterium]|nr:hypothetical protein [Pseudomonadota bacterium]